MIQASVPIEPSPKTGETTYEVAGVDANQCSASLGADTLLLDSVLSTLPPDNAQYQYMDLCRNESRNALEGDADNLERLVNKLLDGVGLTSGQNIVVRGVLLQHTPHFRGELVCATYESCTQDRYLLPST